MNFRYVAPQGKREEMSHVLYNTLQEDLTKSDPDNKIQKKKIKTERIKIQAVKRQAHI